MPIRGCESLDVSVRRIAGLLVAARSMHRRQFCPRLRELGLQLHGPRERGEGSFGIALGGKRATEVELYGCGVRISRGEFAEFGGRRLGITAGAPGIAEQKERGGILRMAAHDLGGFARRGLRVALEQRGDAHQAEIHVVRGAQQVLRLYGLR